MNRTAINDGVDLSEVKARELSAKMLEAGVRVYVPGTRPLGRN
jgi:hypothetical protein